MNADQENIHVINLRTKPSGEPKPYLTSPPPSPKFKPSFYKPTPKEDVDVKEEQLKRVIKALAEELRRRPPEKKDPSM